MSCVCILAPVVVAAWPTFSAAVAVAATSLGYSIVQDAVEQDADGRQDTENSGRVNLEIPNSQLVSDRLARDQCLTVTKDGITVTFSRDTRGKASLCVTGEGYSQTDLRAQGEQLSHRVVQRYVYERIKNEIEARHFVVVEEETDQHQGIRIKVRHWDN